MPLRWIIPVPFFLFSLLYMLFAPHSEHSILSCSCHSVHDVLVTLQTVWVLWNGWTKWRQVHFRWFAKSEDHTKESIDIKYDIPLIMHTLLAEYFNCYWNSFLTTPACKKNKTLYVYTIEWISLLCQWAQTVSSAVAVPVIVRVRTRRPSLQYRRSRSISLSLSAGDSRANPGKAKGNIITAFLITLVSLSPLQAFLPHVWQGGRKLHNLKLHSTHDAGA